MSERSALSELARFIGQSRLGSDTVGSRVAVDAIARRLEPRPVRRKVADLLGVVLTLSARSRRTMLPKVDIQLDVFSPDGSRAVRLLMAQD
jgi:hypothetical protein